MEALNYKIAADKIVDKILEMMNKQDPAMKYTVEFENNKY